MSSWNLIRIGLILMVSRCVYMQDMYIINTTPSVQHFLNQKLNEKNLNMTVLEVLAGCTYKSEGIIWDLYKALAVNDTRSEDQILLECIFKIELNTITSESATLELQCSAFKPEVCTTASDAVGYCIDYGFCRTTKPIRDPDCTYVRNYKCQSVKLLTRAVTTEHPIQTTSPSIDLPNAVLECANSAAKSGFYIDTDDCVKLLALLGKDNLVGSSLYRTEICCPVTELELLLWAPPLTNTAFEARNITKEELEPYRPILQKELSANNGFYRIRNITKASYMKRLNEKVLEYEARIVSEKHLPHLEETCFIARTISAKSKVYTKVACGRHWKAVV